MAAGLGGGSSDAAAALQLANAELSAPLDANALTSSPPPSVRTSPSFSEKERRWRPGRNRLTAVVLPVDYHVVLVVPHSETKQSTAAVYEAFDVRRGANGFEQRATAFHRALESISDSRDLASFRPTISPRRRSRARSATPGISPDVSGAGPVVYGLFEREEDAARAAAELTQVGRTLVTRPLGAVDLP